MPRAAISVTPSFAKRIYWAQLEMGLDQGDFAARLGVSERTIRRWQSGESLPTPAHLKTLARNTGHEISWFTEALSDDQP